MLKKKFIGRFAVCIITFFVFMMFMSCPAIAGIDEHITKTETGFYYTVQKGDTLWDLSEKFSNSPWEWPEMWHYNPEISNPHWIYPGQKILIYKKEWESKEETEPVVEKKEPLQKIEKFFVVEDIDKIGFIRDKAVSPSGSIFKVEEDNTLTSDGDLVYIHLKSNANTVSAGDQFTVYRTLPPISDTETGDYIGIQHLLTGIVEITEVHPEFALGKVVKSYVVINADDLIMPYQPLPQKIILKKSADIEGKIIKTEADKVLISEHDIVFINKGKADGINPGQSYSIYSQESAKPAPGMMPVTLPPVDVGELLVVRTEETTSTALIRDSKKAIEPGQKIHALAP